MREYRPYKHQMGVEGPSFYREQQERRRREQEQQGRDQPKTQDAPPKHQASMWETMFGPAPEERAHVKDPVPSPFDRRGLSTFDPGKWFRVPEIWEYVGNNRRYGGEAFAVDVLTRSTRGDLSQSAGEIAQFFGMQPNEFEGLTLDEAWKQVIGPFLENLEQGMLRLKPFVIPGALRFEIDDEGKLLLVYQDR